MVLSDMNLNISLLNWFTPPPPLNMLIKKEKKKKDISISSRIVVELYSKARVGIMFLKYIFRLYCRLYWFLLPRHSSTHRPFALRSLVSFAPLPLSLIFRAGNLLLRLTRFLVSSSPEQPKREREIIKDLHVKLISVLNTI